MPCVPMRVKTQIGAKTVGIVCGPGEYSHLVRACCPWCCLWPAKTIHGTRLVHGGYCAPDMICGRCGQYWTAEDAGRQPTDSDSRKRNCATVRAMKRKKAPRGWPQEPELPRVGTRDRPSPRRSPGRRR